MEKPLLVIVNGLPGSGKTTLAKRLSNDLRLPVFSRDGLYETLYDALACQENGCPPLIAPATFTLLYSVASSLLSAGKSVIIEGFFGRPELRSAEFLSLKEAYDFEPFQIMCNVDGQVLLERFLARIGTRERHIGHRDLEWIQQDENKERLLHGNLTPLAIGGTVLSIDATTPHSLNYVDLRQRILLTQENYS
ncbi:AAA family ATPase [Paenibacillus sacheonensis]|uniref:AAA family ATPase n=1 Tax=Paenibacillus sacheonensis TaxID=742054 RepID=A0A7X5C4U6_9BACL|nr:AAA family ATPase [Paenibacillus sacheonensis]MBM7569082.1 putative kinase [Paenibacillus sacheonensis]NBC72739.1 AAA family ATPase [Paenibacillus sacheonensis]